MTRTQTLTVAGMALLGAIAVAGWVRKPDPAPSSFVNPYTTAPYATSFDTADRPASMGAVDSPAYTSRRPVRTITQARPAATTYVERQPATVVERQPRVVTRTRSTGKSAAIVAGSAGAGAAIGALAGGGKGAAIGAISGGAGGFVYDRMTRKKRVVVE